MCQRKIFDNSSSVRFQKCLTQKASNYPHPLILPSSIHHIYVALVNNSTALSFSQITFHVTPQSICKVKVRIAFFVHCMKKSFHIYSTLLPSYTYFNGSFEFYCLLFLAFLLATKIMCNMIFIP